jgi:hypothetical protein
MMLMMKDDRKLYSVRELRGGAHVWGVIPNTYTTIFLNTELR